MRSPETGLSKGYGFVSYDNFESSDNALTAMNGNYRITLDQANSLGIRLFLFSMLLRRILRERDMEVRLRDSQLLIDHQHPNP